MHKRLEEFKTSPEIGLDKLTLITDTLVCYQGGGYDGCVWEWNYAYLDKTGKFHNILSSGRCGCETEEALVDNLNDASEYELIPMSNIQKFVNEYSTLNVQAVVHKLNTKHDFSISVTCDDCGEGFSDMEDVTTEYKASGFLCMSCYLNDEEDDEDID